MTVATLPASSSFPQLLKSWRARRRVSQLELALSAGVSQRHLSFLETGRSNPSRASVSQLGEALELPAAEVDTLLVSAGFAPRRDLAGWDPETMRAIELSIDHVLEGHNPYPAVSMDRFWRLKKANASALALFGPFLTESSPVMIREFLRPGPLRDCITNWPEIACALMRLLELEVAQRPHKEGGPELLAEMRALPGVAEARELSPSTEPAPVLSLGFQVGDAQLQFFSLIATIGMSAHVATDDLRIETLMPKDAATRAWFDAQKA